MENEIPSAEEAMEYIKKNSKEYNQMLIKDEEESLLKSREKVICTIKTFVNDSSFKLDDKIQFFGLASKHVIMNMIQSELKQKGYYISLHKDASTWVSIPENIVESHNK